MKKFMPVLIAIIGLVAGMGAGIALKPKAQAEESAASCAVPVDSQGGPDVVEVASPPCPSGDPFAEGSEDPQPAERMHLSYIPIEKPFIVPIFADERTVTMVVLSLSIATEGDAGTSELEALQPRLRDSFLKVMFRHANSGGFDGSYTSGRKIEDLKSALLVAAREVVHETAVDEVLITEIARQDS